MIIPDHDILSCADSLKVQYGVQGYWKDPQAAGQIGDEAAIYWFDDQDRADAYERTWWMPAGVEYVPEFTLVVYDDPPNLKRDVEKVLRFTRDAVEVYGPAVSA